MKPQEIRWESLEPHVGAVVEEILASPTVLLLGIIEFVKAHAGEIADCARSRMLEGVPAYRGDMLIHPERTPAWFHRNMVEELADCMNYLGSRNLRDSLPELLIQIEAREAEDGGKRHGMDALDLVGGALLPPDAAIDREAAIGAS